MSKMKMPEMSVVRFNESDVIVASTLVVSNAADGVDHNLTITRNDVPIYYNGKNQNYFNYMSQYYSPRDDGNYYFYANGTVNALTLNSMQLDDNIANSTPTDGSYKYTGNGNFTRQ